MDLETLCIKKSKWAWVLHCDLLCINLDGGLLDACVMALIAALKNCNLHLNILETFILIQSFLTVKLPVVSYDEETSKLISITDAKMSFGGIKQPVTSTFSLFEKYVVENPIGFSYEALKNCEIIILYSFEQWYIDQ